MFYKVNEKKFEDNTIVKSYKSDSSIYDVIDTVLSSSDGISSITVTDQGDVGMKYFGGTYSFDDFMLIYDRIKLDIEHLNINFQDCKIDFDIPEEWICLLSNNSSIELDDIVKKKGKEKV